MGNVDGNQQPTQYLQVANLTQVARWPKEKHTKSVNFGDLIVPQTVKIALKYLLADHI
mgnify:CR=1 FL=1